MPSGPRGPDLELRKRPEGHERTQGGPGHYDPGDLRPAAERVKKWVPKWIEGLKPAMPAVFWWLNFDTLCVKTKPTGQRGGFLLVALQHAQEGLLIICILVTCVYRLNRVRMCAQCIYIYNIYVHVSRLPRPMVMVWGGPRQTGSYIQYSKGQLAYRKWTYPERNGWLYGFVRGKLRPWKRA